MTEQKSKAERLEMRRALSTHFAALIAGLSEQQIQMPGVNGDWSVKDHIAHLTFWERVNLLEMLKAIEQGTSWTDPRAEHLNYAASVAVKQRDLDPAIVYLDAAEDVAWQLQDAMR